MRPSKEQMLELDRLKADFKFDDMNTAGKFDRDRQQFTTIRHKRCHIIDRDTKQAYAMVSAKEPSDPEDVAVTDEELLTQAILKADASPKPNSVISIREKEAMLARMQLQQRTIDEQSAELARLRSQSTATAPTPPASADKSKSKERMSV